MTKEPLPQTGATLQTALHLPTITLGCMSSDLSQKPLPAFRDLDAMTAGRTVAQSVVTEFDFAMRGYDFHDTTAAARALVTWLDARFPISDADDDKFCFAFWAALKGGQFDSLNEAVCNLPRRKRRAGNQGLF